MTSYANIIKTAFVLFPFLAILITLPYFLYQYHKYGSISKLRIIIVYAFILYLLNAYFLVILPLPTIEQVSHLTTPRMQLIPFNFIIDFINNSPFVVTNFSTYIASIKSIYFYQVAFNLILLLPFGMYSRYYFKNNFKCTILLTFGLSLFFELTQLSGLYGLYPRGYRLFDVDDLIINTLGGIIGYFLVKPFMKILPTRDRIDEKSYEKGMHISSFRRIFALSIDYSIYFVCVFILNKFINSRLLSMFIIMIIYFVIIPTIFNGYTIGKSILKFRIVGTNKINIINYFIRYLLLFVSFIYVPYYYVKGKEILLKMNINSRKIYFIFLCILSIYMLIYIIIYLLKTHKEEQMLYEKISKTKQISSIKRID